MDGHSNLWTASQSNKTYQEYYLTGLEYSIEKIDAKPDPITGILQIKYRSDQRRNHKLVFDGGFLEVKVCLGMLLFNLEVLFWGILQVNYRLGLLGSRGHHLFRYTERLGGS